MKVSVESLLDQARRESGLSDFGDDWFVGPLTAYVCDLNADHLSDWGRAFLTRLALKDLVRRLAIVDCLKRNPEIADVPIPPIVYITGHERSGTTLLHNLLALHDGARYLSRWELMMPSPPPEAATLKDDPRRAEVTKSIDALRGSDLESMHWVEADDPEECVWGFMDCTGLLGMAPGLIMPNWAKWMASNDMSQTFVNYRKIIQLLTWKNPVPEGGFLVLKSPQMSLYLPSFSKVFPEASFLYIHRDPYRVLTSFCTLINIVDGPFLEDANYIADLEREQSFCLNRMGDYYASLERFENAHPDSVCNVQYLDLLNDPEAEIASVFHRLGYPTDSGLAARVTDFLERQRAGARAKPRQSLTDPGYSREAVESDLRIAHYLHHYQLVVEAERQTGQK